MKTKLTLKEQKFLDLLFTSARGNATQAAKGAGYGRTLRSARQAGYKLLTKGDIQRALVARQAREVRRAVLTADERDAILSTIADGKARDHDRIAAIKELNKCGGRHSIKHVIDGRLTLEQILTESRK